METNAKHFVIIEGFDSYFLGDWKSLQNFELTYILENNLNLYVENELGKGKFLNRNTIQEVIEIVQAKYNFGKDQLVNNKEQ